MTTTKTSNTPSLLAGLTIRPNEGFERLTPDEEVTVSSIPALKQIRKGIDESTPEDMRALADVLLNFGQLSESPELGSIDFPFLVQADTELGSQAGIDTVMEFVPALRPFHDGKEWQRPYYAGAAAGCLAIINWSIEHEGVASVLSVPQGDVAPLDLDDIIAQEEAPAPVIQPAEAKGDALGLLCKLSDLGMVYKLFQNGDSYQIIVTIPGVSAADSSHVTYDWQKVIGTLMDVSGASNNIQMSVAGNLINLIISL